jgi:hypothetical protein
MFRALGAALGAAVVAATVDGAVGRAAGRDTVHAGPRSTSDKPATTARALTPHTATIVATV